MIRFKLGWLQGFIAAYTYMSRLNELNVKWIA